MKSNPRSKETRGFALVAVLTIMSLMAVVCVGLLTLSSVTSRKQGLSKDREIARANARMAAMTALGELQRLAGADTRVTANATVLGEDQNLLGVWRSWEGSDRDPNGFPKVPPYSKKTQSGDPVSTDDSDFNTGRFLGWLASGLTQTERTDAKSVPTLPDKRMFSSDDKDEPKIAKLLGDGTLDQMPRPLDSEVSGLNLPDIKDQHVYARIEEVWGNDKDDSRGGIAWWVSGENQKVQIQDSTPNPSIVSDSLRAASDLKRSALPDLTYLNLPDDRPGEINKLFTLKSADLVGGLNTSRNLASYATLNATGLLTNTATGGWKKDLSIFIEDFDDLDKSGLPLLTIRPDEFSSAAKGNGGKPGAPNRLAKGAYIYPWAQTKRSREPNGINFPDIAPTATWDLIANFGKSYERISKSGASGNVIMQTDVDARANNGQYNSAFPVARDEGFLAPQMASLATVLRLKSNVVSGSLDTAVYSVEVRVTPVITLWNPYNVSLDVGGWQVRANNLGYYKYNFRADGSTFYNGSLNDLAGAPGGNVRPVHYRINNVGILRPGETRVFVPDTSSYPVIPKGSGPGSPFDVEMKAGRTFEGGFSIPIPAKNTAKFKGDARVSIQANQVRAMNQYGWYFLSTGTTGSKNYPTYGVISLNFDPNKGSSSQFYRQFTPSDFAEPTLAEFKTDASAFLFLRTEIGIRSASASGGEIPNLRGEYLTRGFIGNRPVISRANTGLGFKLKQYGFSPQPRGSGSPFNSAYNLLVAPISVAGGSSFPQATTDNSAFILTGITPTSGITKCIAAELPLNPIQSLAELQHLNLNGHNLVPPYSTNQIANSAALPLFEKDRISFDTGSDAETVQYDHSYIANNVLFDDWFVSSISPLIRPWRSNVATDSDTIYDEFVTNGGQNASSLPNSAYRPNNRASDAATDLNNDGAFLNIASKLEVSGMFNINSTSVDAWTALLRANLNKSVPVMSDSGSGWNSNTDSVKGTPVSRFSLSNGDRAAGNREARALTAHTVLTDEQVSSLAQFIVDEIVQRGPFLSLSEFVNRRLDDEKLDNGNDMALGGVIDSALRSMASEPKSRNPFVDLQAAGTRVTSTAIPLDAEFKYLDAAEGWTTEGFPGWIRQADILTPLAPIISARDDTFRIRAYGDSRSPGGERILAKAWCEMVVRRTPAYVDSSNEIQEFDSKGDVITTTGLSNTNKVFGRRFEIISFEWLSEDEV